MRTTILAKLASLAAVGAVAAGGLNVAGAIPGPLSNGSEDAGQSGLERAELAKPAELDEVPQLDALPEPAQEGQAFAAEMQEWAACVGEAAAAREGSDEDSGPFDPFEACPNKPHPRDFGIGNAPADVPSGPPADVPSGPPADVPSGPPADVPSGAPADVPSGAPADAPSGPPAGVPTGRP